MERPHPHRPRAPRAALGVAGTSSPTRPPGAYYWAYRPLLVRAWTQRPTDSSSSSSSPRTEPHPAPSAAAASSSSSLCDGYHWALGGRPVLGQGCFSFPSPRWGRRAAAGRIWLPRGPLRWQPLLLGSKCSDRRPRRPPRCLRCPRLTATACTAMSRDCRRSASESGGGAMEVVAAAASLSRWRGSPRWGRRVLGNRIYIYLQLVGRNRDIELSYTAFLCICIYIYVTLCS